MDNNNNKRIPKINLASPKVCKSLLALSLCLNISTAASECIEAQTCSLPSGEVGLCHLGQCLAEVAPESRQNLLQFMINVKYPEKSFRNLTSPDLYIRGSGLGLTWKSGIILSKVAEDTWTINITYRSSARGYACQNCSDFVVMPGNKLQYRILINDRIDMKGPNFAIALPVSKVSTYFKRKPLFTVCPWFYETTGSLQTFDVHSQIIGGKRTICIYRPPSFTENIYKQYMPILVFDFNYNMTKFFKKNIEEPILQRVSEEYVLIGFGDYANETERMDLLTPVEGQGPTCYNGTLEDDCDGCIPNTDNVTEVMHYMNICTYPSPVGGRGNRTLDFLLLEVIPMAEIEVKGNRLESRTVGLMGYSLGGLMACHGAWTRTEKINSAICQSPSFFWPNDQLKNTAAFHFINDTLKESFYQQNRPRQKFYIDAGSEEDMAPYRLTQSAIEVAEYISLREPYALYDDVWLAVEPGRAHGYVEWGRRMGQALAVVMSADGDPEMPKFDTDTNVSSSTIVRPYLLVFCVSLCLVRLLKLFELHV